jgi:hypothetical protein
MDLNLFFLFLFLVLILYLLYSRCISKFTRFGLLLVVETDDNLPFTSSERKNARILLDRIESICCGTRLVARNKLSEGICELEDVLIKFSVAELVAEELAA